MSVAAGRSEPSAWRRSVLPDAAARLTRCLFRLPELGQSSQRLPGRYARETFADEPFVDETAVVQEDVGRPAGRRRGTPRIRGAPSDSQADLPGVAAPGDAKGAALPSVAESRGQRRPSSWTRPRTRCRWCRRRRRVVPVPVPNGFAPAAAHWLQAGEAEAGRTRCVGDCAVGGFAPARPAGVQARGRGRAIQGDCRINAGVVRSRRVSVPVKTQRVFSCSGWLRSRARAARALSQGAQATRQTKARCGLRTQRASSINAGSDVLFCSRGPTPARAARLASLARRGRRRSLRESSLPPDTRKPAAACARRG